MARMAQAQAQVEEMLKAGASFEHVEAYIEGRQDLTAELRSALWLLAWAETTPEARRVVIREMVDGARQDALPLVSRAPRARAVSPVKRR